MIYKYGIDFGTTNSSIAIRFVGDDKQEHTLVVDVKDTLPRETIPSVVLVDNRGNILAGEDAMNQYMQDGLHKNGRKLIKQIKLDLENKGSQLEYDIDGNKISGIDLISSILEILRMKAEKVTDELEIEISGVVMGVPVQKNVLKHALVKA